MTQLPPPVWPTLQSLLRDLRVEPLLNNLISIYAMITNQQSYNEETAFKLSPKNRERQLLRIEKQAAQLGFKIVALA